MKIFKNKHKLEKEILNIRNICFVPTMGGLHKGHISLIKKSKSFKGKTLVSIFVNPKQFNNKKDFSSYPRNMNKDLKILKNLKVDIVYIPDYQDIYDFEVKNKIYLDNCSKILCGKFRKGHFEGVINVINRFLEIIKPKYIFLGIKDFQQLYLISAHIKKREIKTKVISCKTLREKNGVACSTRNRSCTKKQLLIASKVYNHLLTNKKKLIKDLKKYNYLKLEKDLLNFGLKKIDYIKVYNQGNFKLPVNRNKKIKIFIAYYLDKIRLIDNI